MGSFSPGLNQSFASDNHAGVHPEVFAALAAANEGDVAAYGGDPYTARLDEVFGRHFGERARVFPVFNGTGANVVGLQAMADRWSSVVCTATSHVQVDECGAVERVAGLKLVPVETPDGKLTPALAEPHVLGWGDDVHHAPPGVLTITQSTELGTVYTPDEVRALADFAHGHGMSLHMDGSRVANAAASLDLPLRAFTTDAGVDVLSFGGTKNGLMMGEAIVVLNPDAVRGLDYLRMMNMQLASKMRFVSAQLIALLDGDLWLRNARHANSMAHDLATAVRDLPHVRLTQPVQSNAVFATLPPSHTTRLSEFYAFHPWNPATGEVRWMCSFTTTPTDVALFTKTISG
ncbi:threonine aldolase family protein [Actinomadura flavalba]|uniref:threonine aldolase family protein n=1 Tax=Actinomadura flavalba TaxID=1120938 RepID=UPI00036986FF|nr:low specificity L-threonine aldolase [Actinomadura flavalba]